MANSVPAVGEIFMGDVVNYMSLGGGFYLGTTLPAYDVVKCQKEEEDRFKYAGWRYASEAETAQYWAWFRERFKGE